MLQAVYSQTAPQASLSAQATIAHAIATVQPSALTVTSVSGNPVTSLTTGQVGDYKFSYDLAKSSYDSWTSGFKVGDPSCAFSMQRIPQSVPSPVYAYLGDASTPGQLAFIYNPSGLNLAPFGGTLSMTSCGLNLTATPNSKVTASTSATDTSKDTYAFDIYIKNFTPGTKTVSVGTLSDPTNLMAIGSILITPAGDQAPTVLSILPQNATSQTATLTATVQDLDGLSDFDYVELRVTDSNNSASDPACILRYRAATSTFALWKASDSTWITTATAGVFLGSNCEVSNPTASRDTANKTITLTAPTKFGSSLVGSRKYSVGASDIYGALVYGSTQLTVGAAPERPGVTTKSTATGITVTALFTDAITAFSESDVLIGGQVLTPSTAPPTTTNTCWVKYDYIQGAASLWQGSTNSWLPFSGTSATSASCTVNNLSPPTASSNKLSYDVTYGSGFFGAKQVWATATDRTGAGQGIWYSYAGYTIPSNGAADCITAISPAQGFIGPGGGVGSIAITNPAACGITSTSDSPTWLSTAVLGLKSFTITGGTSPYSVSVLTAPSWISAGLCSGSTNAVCYSLTSNPSTTARTATIRVTDQSNNTRDFAVTQAGN